MYTSTTIQLLSVKTLNTKVITMKLKFHSQSSSIFLNNQTEQRTITWLKF